MSAPWWVRWTVATIMVVIAGYHLARLVLAHRRRRRPELDVDLTHAAMGAVMAIMLVSTLPAVSSRTWALCFALAGLWFAGVGAREFRADGVRGWGPPVRQASLCVAMVYMLAAGAGMSTTSVGMTSMTGGPGVVHGAAGRSLDLLMIAVVAAVAAWTVAHLARPAERSAAPRHPAGGSPAGPLAPTLTATCQLAMNATTAYMLVLLLS